MSEVVGEGADARRLVKVGAWELAEFVGRGEDEPRVRDVDLAARLGFARPRKIRELIERYAANGEIAPLSNRPTAGRFTKDGKARGSTTLVEHWLSEADALFLAAKSETPQANAITREMIRVYMLARRGLLPGQRTTTDPALLRLVQQQGDVLALIVRRLDAVEARLARDTGVCGEEWGRDLRARLRRIANVAVGAPAGDPLGKPARAHLRRVENVLRGEFAFSGRGCSWRNFPKGATVRVLARRLEALENEAIELGRDRPDPRQMPLKAVR